ncbi:MAG TPA: alpha/beta fold hydrolase [Terriglobales bacterium]|nr:alpha/beta fold hydrolase [Terriglobales bacterium]
MPARSHSYRILYFLVAFYISASIFGGISLGWIALHPNSPPIRDYEEHNARAYAAAHSIEFQDVALTAPDGAVLKAWYERPPNANGDTVLLLHGVVDNRLGVYPFSKWLVERGYTVLMPDARHHGASGGLTTYGIREVGDIRRWIDWMEKDGLENEQLAKEQLTKDGTDRNPLRCVYGLGESMGGMELLESLPTEPRFCAIIAESPSASFREEAYARFGRSLHIGPWLGRTFFRPTLDAGILFVRLRYGVNFDNVKPAEAVVGSKVPILLIHGEADRNVLPYHSDIIHAMNPLSIEVWKVPAAAHCGASKVAPEEFKEKVLQWFADHGPSQHAN